MIIREVGDEIRFRNSHGRVIPGVIVDIGFNRYTVFDSCFENNHVIVSNDIVFPIENKKILYERQ